jgi:hypothetical protein
MGWTETGKHKIKKKVKILSLRRNANLLKNKKWRYFNDFIHYFARIGLEILIIYIHITLIFN